MSDMQKTYVAERPRLTEIMHTPGMNVWHARRYAAAQTLICEQLLHARDSDITKC